MVGRRMERVCHNTVRVLYYKKRKRESIMLQGGSGTEGRGEEGKEAVVVLEGDKKFEKRRTQE